MGKTFKKNNKKETPEAVEPTDITDIEEVQTKVDETVYEEVKETKVESVPETTISIDAMTDRALLEYIYWTLKDIEAAIQKAPVASAGPVSKVGRASSRRTVVQKKERKAELLAAGPYTKEKLTGMVRSDLTMYASAMKLGKDKTFGIATSALIENILAGQK